MEVEKKASQSYYYDATNRLVEGTNWKGDVSAYNYNGLGQRVENTVTMHSGKVYSREYVVDYTSPENNDLYVYATGNGQLDYEQRHVYVDGERVEQYTDRFGDGDWERLLYVHEDNRGSTWFYSKENGQGVFTDLEYDVWGMPTSPGKLQNNDRGNYVFATYTGHIYDPVLDIYFAEARFYDATNRQWLASDPIKSGYNWYQYCQSNPLIYADYNGKFPIPLITGAIGAIGGAIISGVSSIISQSKSGEGVDWKQVGKSAVTGMAIGGLAGLTMGAAAVALPAAGVAVGLQTSMALSSVGITMSSTAIAGVEVAATVVGGVSIGMTGLFAASNAVEAGSGYNPIRDFVLGGKQNSYSSLQIANSLVNFGIIQLGTANYALGSLNPTKDVLEKTKSYFMHPGCNSMDQQPVFPENPLDFNPDGLKRVGPFQTKNGDIIKWLDSEGKAVYEWDEDLQYGEHYHLIGSDGNSRIPDSTGETHFKAGYPVPSPEDPNP